MGCASTNIPNEKNTPKESNTPKQSNEPKESPEVFRKEELSFINDQKEKIEAEIQNGIEQGGDKIYPIFRKIDLDLTQKFFQLKEYLVFYIPSDYSKSTAEYDEPPPINNISEYIDSRELKKNKHYCKINGNPKLVKNFKFIQDPNPEIDYDSYIRHVEFELSPKDKEKNLVTMETGYNIKLFNKYGLYDLRFYYSDNTPNSCTFSFTVDDNYMVCHPYKDYFQEIMKYKLYSFNKEDVSLTLRDKRIIIKIENELDKELLSNFTPEEIKQINISLNKIEYHYDYRHLIYQKVVHDIKKDGRDYIKIYDIVYYPHPEGSASGSDSSPIRSPQALIVKRLRINNLLVPKRAKHAGYEDEDENNEDEDGEKLEESDFQEDPNEEGYEQYKGGYYLSGHNVMGFYTMFTGTFALFEFDCVSNERLDYLPFYCNDIGEIDKSVVYGASYKYEVILNGHSVKFSNENFDYSVKNGRIIVQGMIDGNKDNYDNKKYEELCIKQDRGWWMDEKSENYRLKNWAELRLQEFLPKTMKLV